MMFLVFLCVWFVLPGSTTPKFVCGQPKRGREPLPAHVYPERRAREFTSTGLNVFQKHPGREQPGHRREQLEHPSRLYA